MDLAGPRESRQMVRSELTADTDLARHLRWVYYPPLGDHLQHSEPGVLMRPYRLEDPVSGCGGRSLGIVARPLSLVHFSDPLPALEDIQMMAHDTDALAHAPDDAVEVISRDLVEVE